MLTGLYSMSRHWVTGLDSHVDNRKYISLPRPTKLQHIQGVSEGIVNILGGSSKDYSE